MGCCSSVPLPERPPVPEGKIRICIAGLKMSHNVGTAKLVSEAIFEKNEDKYEFWF